MTHRTYFGYIITPMGRNSWGGRWECYCIDEFLAADTLSGLKNLIREKHNGH